MPEPFLSLGGLFARQAALERDLPGALTNHRVAELWRERGLAVNIIAEEMPDMNALLQQCRADAQAEAPAMAEARLAPVMAARAALEAAVAKYKRALIEAALHTPSSLEAAPAAIAVPRAEPSASEVEPPPAAAAPPAPERALKGAALVGCVIRLVRADVTGSITDYNACSNQHTIDTGERVLEECLSGKGKVAWELVERGTLAPTPPTARGREKPQWFGLEAPASIRVGKRYQAQALPEPDGCKQRRADALVRRGSPDADVTPKPSDVKKLSGAKPLRSDAEYLEIDGEKWGQERQTKRPRTCAPGASGA